MDELLSLIPGNVAQIVLLVLTGLSLGLPVLEWAAKLTKTDTDDKIVVALTKFLGLIPRVRLGQGVTK